MELVLRVETDSGGTSGHVYTLLDVISTTDRAVRSSAAMLLETSYLTSSRRTNSFLRRR